MIGDFEPRDEWTCLEFHVLRCANKERAKEWDTNNQLTTSFKGNELSGEIGEAIEIVLDTLGYSTAIAAAGGKASNVVKKLERERLGIKGSRATKEMLAKELADIVICVDLLAAHEGIDLAEAVINKFNETSEKQGLKVKI